jgi:hypothetical protein
MDEVEAPNLVGPLWLELPLPLHHHLALLRLFAAQG